MQKTRKTSTQARDYPPGSFLGKLRKRRIIETLAAVSGSGWFVYELVHWILVEHYHLPERLKDFTIVSVCCAILSALTWRWFRSERRRRKIKLEFVLIPAFLLTMISINVNILLHVREDKKEYRSDHNGETPWKNSVAVLPFVDMSPIKDQEYFSDGLTEELINNLSKIQELRVAGRTSSFQFKGRNEDLREICQKLNVAAILEGSVRKSIDRVRITAQLIDGNDGFHLWSETYDRQLDDIFAVQEEISLAVADALKVTLLDGKRFSVQTDSAEAYNALLLGRYFYARQTRESLEKSIEYYGRAIEIDPSYARAWAGLAGTYAFQAASGYVPPEESYKKAKNAVKKALVLDKNLAYAHAVLGWIQMSCDWDWTQADASFQKAMSLEPGRGRVEAAQLATAMGRFEEAILLAHQTFERDPISMQVLSTLALANWYGGRSEEAIAAYRKALEIIPEYPALHGLIGLVYITQSKLGEAFAELEQTKDPYWRLPGLAMVLHSMGKREDSDAALAEFIEKYQAGGAYNISQAYAFRGEADLTFQWLERAYDQHDGGLFLMNVDPFLSRMKSDPRFKSLLKKMRLPV